MIYCTFCFASEGAFDDQLTFIQVHSPRYTQIVLCPKWHLYHLYHPKSRDTNFSNFVSPNIIQMIQIQDMSTIAPTPALMTTAPEVWVKLHPETIKLAPVGSNKSSATTIMISFVVGLVFWKDQRPKNWGKTRSPQRATKTDLPVDVHLITGITKEKLQREGLEAGERITTKKGIFIRERVVGTQGVDPKSTEEFAKGAEEGHFLSTKRRSSTTSMKISENVK